MFSNSWFPFSCHVLKIFWHHTEENWFLSIHCSVHISNAFILASSFEFLIVSHFHLSRIVVGSWRTLTSSLWAKQALFSIKASFIPLWLENIRKYLNTYTAFMYKLHNIPSTFKICLYYILCIYQQNNMITIFLF